MKIIEKITETQFIGQKETGIYAGTRYFIETNIKLEEGQIISNDDPIEGKFMTLCELCAEIYDGGEDYDERMKQQAIDFKCGFIDEIEINY